METMTSRERVLRALNHQPTDRIPIDIGGMHNLTTMHIDAYQNLKEHLGLTEEAELSSPHSQSVQPTAELLRRFHSDCAPLYIPLQENEKNPTQEADGSETYVDIFGVKWRRAEGSLYFGAEGHPMADFEELEEFEAYPFPDPNYDYGYDMLAARAKELYETTDYALVMNGPLDGATYVPVQQWMGFEEFFVKLLTEPEIVEFCLDKVVEFQIAQWKIIFDKMGDYFQVVRISDDLGTQNAPIMSPDTYRELIKPRQKKIVDYIKSRKPDIKIIYHCDGAVLPFLPDMVEIGFDAWNPVQVTADGIDDTARLKREFGDKLCFWGAGCDSQQVIARETPDGIRAEVRRRINDLAAGGGLVLGSIHNLQKNVPPENMVAFYDALGEYSVAYYQNGGRV